MANVTDKTDSRDPKGRFRKGQSGNPSGRRYRKGFKGMAAYIRNHVGASGEEIVDYALKVFRNEERCYTHADRWNALQFLADRGFGKPVATTVEMQVDESEADPLDLSGESFEKLAEMEAALELELDRILGAVGK